MDTTAAPKRHVLTVFEVADRAGVSIHTVRRAIAAGQLPATRVGPGQRILRVWPADVDRWLGYEPEVP